jgi:hypothetical protein
MRIPHDYKNPTARWTYSNPKIPIPIGWDVNQKMGGFAFQLWDLNRKNTLHGMRIRPELVGMGRGEDR